MVKFICYPKCTTCQKAKKWLDDNKIEYEIRDIKLENPSLEELTAWWGKSGLPLKKFFNTSGLLYKSLELKSKLPSMTEEEMVDAARLAYMAEGMKYALIFIASAPMLIIYPFVQKHFVKGVMIGSLKG